MKIFKKMLVAMSCLLMVIGVNMNVLAAETGSITINAGDIDINGKTFSAYKIMDVTVSGDNVAYTIADDFKDFFSEKVGSTDDTAAYNYLKDTDVTTLRSELSTYIQTNNITVSGTTTGTEASTATISGLSYGYYLVIPSDVTMQANLTTLKDTNQDVYIKGIDPSVDKKADNEDWTSAQIGDTVNFTVTSMVPDMTGKTEYYFRLIDTLSEGLTFNADSVIVKIGDTVLIKDTDYTVTTKPVTDGTEVTISFTNFINHAKEAGKAITFEYSAVLNEKADASDKESNSAKVEWSNDPDFSADGDGGTSTPDTTIVRTYQLTITKTDEKDNKLAGAHFEILRGSETDAIKLVQESAGDATNAAVYRVATATEIADGTTIVTEVVSPASGLIQIKGLDADVYQVKETQAPDGYNKAASQSTTITVTSTDNGVTVNVSGNDVTVVNKAGVLLPETGSKGTVLFTIVGVALAGLVVGSFVISRRKED